MWAQMVEPAPRSVDIESLVADMRPPTDDDVPMTSDWQPLDTREALVAYLNEINECRERNQVTRQRSVAPPVAPHGEQREP